MCKKTLMTCCSPLKMIKQDLLRFPTIFLNRFVCKNTGVLFETDILQVGIKSEFKDDKGK